MGWARQRKDATPFESEHEALAYLDKLPAYIAAECRLEDAPPAPCALEEELAARELLGVDPEASAAAVTAAYRRAAMDLHSDRNPATDAEERFKAAKAAYELLTREG